MRNGIVAVTLLLVYASTAKAAGPLPMHEVLQIVHTDLKRLPVETQQYTRYLDLHYLATKKERDTYVRTLCGHLNGLSRESDIVRLVVVDQGGFVLRFDLREYRLDPKVYEKLAEADPYYHVKTVTEEETKTPWPGGIDDREGKYYPKGTFNVISKKRTVKTAIAPILTEGAVQLALVADLVKWTGSSVFLLSAEWFFNQTAAAADRTPNYYDFLGIKNEKDFQRVGGFDQKLAADFGLTELREAVADSTVTLQPRAIRRDEKIGGAYWRSFDFRKAIDRRNPLRVLGKDIEAEYDASEQFIHLANGMWATGLFNKAGDRQDTAPDFIASDGVSKSTDHRVHVNIGCLRCHTNGGMQDIDGWNRNLFDGPPLKLQSPDFEVQKRLKQQYIKKLEPFLDADRKRYDEAVKEATGWTSPEYSGHLSEAWESYEDAKVDLDWLAARLSVEPKVFKAAMLDYVTKTGSIDQVLANFLKDKPRTIKIRQAEEVFPLAYLALKGYQVP